MALALFAAIVAGAIETTPDSQQFWIAIIVAIGTQLGLLVGLILKHMSDQNALRVQTEYLKAIAQKNEAASASRAAGLSAQLENGIKTSLESTSNKLDLMLRESGKGQAE